jgi:hypothetical protein
LAQRDPGKRAYEEITGAFERDSEELGDQPYGTIDQDQQFP